MIEKERLEELIEQGATIYEVKYNNINPVSLANKIRDVYYKNGVIAVEPRPDEKYLHHKYFKRLFETKEDAEFALEFQNITRTETLNLPTWEELNIIDEIKIYGEYGKRYIVQVDEYDISIYASDGYDFILYKRFERTKKNYIKACTIARKLFLGESVEKGENNEESKN